MEPRSYQLLNGGIVKIEIWGSSQVPEATHRTRIMGDTVRNFKNWVQIEEDSRTGVRGYLGLRPLWRPILHENPEYSQISLQDDTKIPRDTVRRLMAEIDPDGQRQDSPGADLNFKALWMGPAGIDIYGSRCHSSSKMVKFLAVLNARCSSTVGRYYLDLVEHGVFVQATVDGGSETGELYAAHVAFCQHCMPDISVDDATPFVALKSTDNIPIESSWHLFTNYVGLDIKQILLLGKSHNYFNSAYQLDLFNWLWPKIIQFTLDNFLDYWNNHKIRTQHNKLLPSGFSPNYICDFPEKFGLTHFGVAAPQPLIDALLQNIPKTLKECYRWVPGRV
ncbi:hypothetical protein B0H14DRAFT_3141015 [Mycena olivaceomarginata]|nr:hypothetical protein B0H14DRAFT_3141015 [Mycena olivaceomarginata]